MPSLKKMLQSYDLDMIERISSFWSVDTTSLDLSASIETLYKAMQNKTLSSEILESLSEESRNAWEEVHYNPQKITWAHFTRKFGEVREFGPARREREEPEQHPISIAETLWYKGLIGRAFLNLPPEPREFVFIPDELIPADKSKEKYTQQISLPTVDAATLKTVAIADGRIIDHLTDWLAAKRMKRLLPKIIIEAWAEPETFLAALAETSGLINTKGDLVTDALSLFFQMDRSAILSEWAAFWIKSPAINDLHNIPGLIFEGDWQNDPLKARQFIVETLHTLKQGEWYSQRAFAEQIKTIQPDFQRSGGEYDSWFIRKVEGTQFLRGFEFWDDVDGTLIRYLITGPLHWLGMTDLGRSQEKSDTAFRLTASFFAQDQSQNPPVQTVKETPIKISSDLSFTIPISASRPLRYQIARFCEIRSLTTIETCYQITPASLKAAQQYGLKPSQLVQYLEKNLKTPLPKSLTLLADQWEKNSSIEEVTHGTLLRTHSPDVLQKLDENSHTAKFILEKLNPTVALINPSGIKTIKQTLLEQGLLTETNQDK